MPVYVPIMLDGEIHKSYRAPLAAPFSPQIISKLEKDLRNLANSLIADFRNDGGCEIVKDFAEPYSLTAILKILGLPVDKIRHFRSLIKEFKKSSRDMGEIIQKQWDILDALRDFVMARRGESGPDVFATLWRTEVNGKTFSSEDIENYEILLFTAGLDTAINAIAYGTRHLALDPDLQKQLRENPQLIDRAVDEILRRYTFSTAIRIATEDMEFFGRNIRRGDMVVLYLPAANLDRRAFSHPEMVVIDRQKGPSISFGAGPHRCVGEHLARLELRIAYKALLSGLPRFSINSEEPTLFHGGFVIGIDALPLSWPVGQVLTSEDAVYA